MEQARSSQVVPSQKWLAPVQVDSSEHTLEVLEQLVYSQEVPFQKLLAPMQEGSSEHSLIVLEQAMASQVEPFQKWLPPVQAGSSAHSVAVLEQFSSSQVLVLEMYAQSVPTLLQSVSLEHSEQVLLQSSSSQVAPFQKQAVPVLSHSTSKLHKLQVLLQAEISQELVYMHVYEEPVHEGSSVHIVQSLLQSMQVSDDSKQPLVQPASHISAKHLTYSAVKLSDEIIKLWIYPTKLVEESPTVAVIKLADSDAFVKFTPIVIDS